MSDVIATCSKGHKWKATKVTVMRGVIVGRPTVTRVVDPPTCPECKGEWIATYERNERIP